MPGASPRETGRPSSRATATSAASSARAAVSIAPRAAVFCISSTTIAAAGRSTSDTFWRAITPRMQVVSSRSFGPSSTTSMSGAPRAPSETRSRIVPVTAGRCSITWP